MRELLFSPIPALVRVVARPATVDACEEAFAGAPGPDARAVPGWWRLAPDEVLVGPGPGAEAVRGQLTGEPDEHAIVEPDPGWALAVLDGEQFDREIAGVLEWRWPEGRSTAQGLLHNVAVKIQRASSADAGAELDVEYRILCPRSLVHELEERLGWSNRHGGTR